MSSEITVQDNFLDKELFEYIRNTMLSGFDGSGTFPWYMNNGTVVVSDENIIPLWESENLSNDAIFSWTHVFFHNHYSNSQYYDKIILPLLDKINPVAVARVKGNLYPCTDEIIEHGYHVDYEDSNSNAKTSIFYLNTNNGYTKLLDGTVIESIANRLLTFPTNMPHTSSTCNDKQIRSNININYYK
jgi:hypothetical protein